VLRPERRQACRVASLEDLPEELVLELFDAVLRRGKLQPRVLALFEVWPAPRSAPLRTGACTRLHKQALLLATSLTRHQP